MVRSLGRLGVRTTLASPNQGGITGLSRYAAGWDRWEPRDLDDDRALEALRLIGERRTRPVLFPTDDLSALFVDAHANELRRVFGSIQPCWSAFLAGGQAVPCEPMPPVGHRGPGDGGGRGQQQAARFLDEA